MKIELFLFFLIHCLKISSSCVFVQLKDGIIKGRIASISNSTKTFHAFQQIPYAQPPTGNLRFQPPQPVKKWSGILDARRNTKTCFQIGPNTDQETEDCLYLNVYTPTLERRYLPVMVYFHGGGFILGDGTYQSYGPDYLVEQDVVVVTLNYRLGVFGFLSTGDNVVPGNNGLKDQLFALHWVRQNIERFGGSSDQIVIFGQSAGAASVGFHLLSPKSSGLFKGAIMESGSAISAFAYQRNAKYYAYKIASLVNSTITEQSTSEELLNTLQYAFAKDIDRLSENVTAEESYYNAQLFQGYYYAPVIEPLGGPEAFITEYMYETIYKGNASRVPIIMGMNSEESLSSTTDLSFVATIMGAFDSHLEALVPNDMHVNDTQRTEAGESIRQLYVGNGQLQNNSAAGIKYMSDSMVTRSVMQHAALQSNFSEVYFYQFSYDGTMGNVSIVVEGADRVGHNEELPYIWRINSDGFNNYNISIFPPSDLVTRNRLIEMWTNFAKTLRPTPQRSELLQETTWQTVGEDNSFNYLNIGNNLEMRTNPKEHIYVGWREIYDKYENRPLDTY